MNTDLINNIAIVLSVFIGIVFGILFALDHIKRNRNFRLKKYKPKQTNVRLFR